MQSSEPIDVLCPLPPGLSPVLVDRCLFSIVHQSHRELYVSILIDDAAERDVARIVEGLDWSGFPRKPRFVRYRGVPPDEGASRSFALAQAEHRFVGVVDARGTLYARAYELLLEQALESRAAIVYGDTILKEMRAFETFLYEEHRRYRGAASSGLDALRSGALPPLGACLLDRDRIAASDLAFGADSDEAFVFGLLSRYPALRVKDHVPVSAHQDAAAGIGRNNRRRGLDHLMLALRECRRRLTANSRSAVGIRKVL